MQSRTRAWALSLSGAILVALGFVLLRLTLEARSSLNLADARKDAGEVSEAIAHYLDAARASYPGNPFAKQALDRLWQLASPAQLPLATPPGEEPEVVRQALEAFRAAVLSTRSFYVSRASKLDEANARLAEIYARREGRNARPVARAFEQRRQWHVQRLAVIPGPKLVWVVTALVGLIIWLGAIAAFITKALTPSMRVKRGPALGAGLAFVCGFGLFLLGLIQ